MTIAIALFVAILASTGRGGSMRTENDRDAVEIYQPRAEHFRPEYERDQVNGKLQTWDQYWAWIGTFYQGNLFARGWTQETKATIAVVTTPEVRRDLSRALNEIGRDVAREWAKETAARRIHIKDVKSWGNRLRAAREADDGNGDSLIATVKVIRDEVSKKLNTEPVTIPDPSARSTGSCSSR